MAFGYLGEREREREKILEDVKSEPGELNTRGPCFVAARVVPLREGETTERRAAVAAGH